jgi:hypothetical protein
MARKITPKCRANNQWSEAKFWSFLRSGLRRLSTRWPPVYAARKDARRPYSGPRKNQKWEAQCAICKGWFVQKDTHVEHTTPVGSLLRYEDLPGFVERLLCEKDGLKIVCRACHQTKTNAEREARKHTDTQ